MATFSSAAYTANTPTSTHGYAANAKIAAASVAVTTALALNDTVNFFYMPAGATLRGANLRCSVPLDSNGSPTLTIDVGDATTAARIFSASLAGSSASGSDAVPVWASLGYQFPAKTLIFATVHAAGATKVAGSMTLVLHYTLEGQAS
jgi:hypothetical protein